MNLIHDDCLNAMKDLEDNSVDLILTDLPYGTTACKWDTIIDLDAFWKECWRVGKENVAVVLFASQPFTTRLISSNYEDYRYNYVWIKEKGSNALTVNKMPFKKHEDICVFYKKMPFYNPQGKKKDKPVRRVHKRENIEAKVARCGDTHSDMSDHRRLSWMDRNNADEFVHESTHFKKTTILEYSRDSNKGKSHHPTEKPIALLEDLIKTYTLEGETVLDATMGSGSTGVASVNTDREFIGIELEEKYFNVATTRIEEAMNQPFKKLFGKVD